MSTYILVSKYDNSISEIIRITGEYSYEDASKYSVKVSEGLELALGINDYRYNRELNVIENRGNVPAVKDPTSSEATTVVNMMSLEDTKASCWALLKAHRDELEFGGFEYNGNTYDSDSTSQGRILGAYLSNQDQQWTLSNNSVIQLTALQIKELYLAMQEHIANLHERGRVARQKIVEATTVDEVCEVTL